MTPIVLTEQAFAGSTQHENQGHPEDHERGEDAPSQSRTRSSASGERAVREAYEFEDGAQVLKAMATDPE